MRIIITICITVWFRVKTGDVGWIIWGRGFADTVVECRGNTNRQRDGGKRECQHAVEVVGAR